MKTNAKFEKLLTKYATLIADTGRTLAINFDLPARDIIAVACFEMKISQQTWRDLASYRIAKAQASDDATDQQEGPNERG